MADSPLLARLFAPRDPAGRWWDRASILLLIVALLVALSTFGDYGITWDEWPHIGYGDRVAAFWGTGFADQSAVTFRTNYFYGGGYDYLGALFRWLAKPLASWRAMHLLGALVGVLGVAGTWQLARRLAGPFAGFAAALLLATNPVYWGHMFNNPKDLPFAVGYVWALRCLVDLIAALPRPSRRQWILLAITTGMAMSVRIAGVLLLCYLGLAVLVYADVQGRVRRSAAASWAYLARLGPRIAAVAASAWLIMLLTWPWALLDPIRRPFLTLVRMSQYTDHKRLMPFAGQDIWTHDVDWTYLPHYFGYQLPEFVLALTLLATLVAIFTVARRITDPRHHLRALALLTLGVAIWLPPLYAIVRGSILYDGYRHFLFVVPPLTVLAALLLDLGVASLARRIGRSAQLLAAGLLALVGADLVRTMLALHPHEYVYFNRLIGGVGGAQGDYDTDYYGNSYKEAAEGLARYVWQTEPANYLDTVYYYSGCVTPFIARHYLPPNFRSQRRRPDRTRHADFFLGYTRSHCDRHHPDAPVVFAVHRRGADLNLVKDLRDGETNDSSNVTRDAGMIIGPRLPGDRDAAPQIGPALPPDLAAERAARRASERPAPPPLEQTTIRDEQDPAGDPP